jgi:hypothetical protein
VKPTWVVEDLTNIVPGQLPGSLLLVIIPIIIVIHIPPPDISYSLFTPRLVISPPISHIIIFLYFPHIIIVSLHHPLQIDVFRSLL